MMKRIYRSLILSNGVAGLSLLALSASALAGHADLSDWVGSGNTTAPNNYVVTSSSSAGGSFADPRPAAISSLSDHTLVGGPFSWTSPLSMSGTVEFSGGFDPVAFLGWYSSSNINNMVGIGVANPVPAGTGIRWQTQSSNSTNNGVVSQNFGTTTTNSTLAPGTYSFSFDYDGAGHMTGSLGPLNFARNFAAPADQNLGLDRFGFLQRLTNPDDTGSFTWIISNINYTGETQVPEPSAFGLLVLGLAWAVGYRK